MNLRKFNDSELSYRLQSLQDAPLPQVTIQKGLQKKNADVSFLAEVCSAADTESGGRMASITQKLMKRARESAFHQFWSRSLPKVSKLELPVIFSKQKRKVGLRKCSVSAACLLFFP